jgi:hypothetical protein
MAASDDTSLRLHWFLPTGGDARDVLPDADDPHRREPDLAYLAQTLPCMRHVAVVVGLCSVLAGSAFGLTLESPKVDATLFTDSSKDRFKIRAQLGGADPAAVAAGSMILRFGDLQTRIPAGGFRPRGKKSFVWRSFLLGVKKVTINVKKGTLTVVGGGQELGDLPGPTMLAIATSQGATCGQMSWGKTKGKKKRVRKRAEGPFPACEGGIGSPATAPQVVIDSPTALAGTTTAGGTITIGGRASDDQAVASLAWSSDRGGGGLLTPADTWSVVDVPLLPGDYLFRIILEHLSDSMNFYFD